MSRLIDDCVDPDGRITYTDTGATVPISHIRQRSTDLTFIDPIPDGISNMVLTETDLTFDISDSVCGKDIKLESVEYLCDIIVNKPCKSYPLLSDDTTMCNFGIIFCIILILRISTKTNVVLLLLIALLLSFVFKDYCLF